MLREQLCHVCAMVQVVCVMPELGVDLCMSCCFISSVAKTGKNKERNNRERTITNGYFRLFPLFTLIRSVPQAYLVVIEFSVNSFNFYKM